MGGNVGDALAPLVVGALLRCFTWREVVVMNVMPGVVMSVLILAFLGTLRLAPKRPAQSARCKAHEAHEGQTLREYLGGLGTLFRNRNLVLLSTSSAFRSMTQNALLTFLPVYLAYEMGYSPIWVGACMFVLQAAGFAASPIAGHLSDRMGRRSIMMTSMAMTAVVLLFMGIAGQFAGLHRVHRGAGLLPVRDPSGAAGLAAGGDAEEHGRHRIGILFGAQSLGAAIGPLIGGVIADRYGLYATFYFLASTIVVANLFILFMPSTRFAKPVEAAGAMESGGAK